MSSVYRSPSPWKDKGSSVLVLACGANDFFPYLRDFMQNGLKLEDGTYDVLLVPGGPQFLQLSEYLPKFAWVGGRWIKFLLERHGLHRIVVIAHNDCAWYHEERLIPASLLRHGSVLATAAEREKRDLIESVSMLAQTFPGVAVEGWVVEKDGDGKLTFTRT